MEFNFFMGIDVQISRKCPYMVLNNKSICISSGWLEGESTNEICKNLIYRLANFDKKGISNIAIGIDAPRVPLKAPRQYFWIELVNIGEIGMKENVDMAGIVKLF